MKCKNHPLLKIINSTAEQCVLFANWLSLYCNTRQLQSSYNNFNSFKAAPTQQRNGKTVWLLANVIIRRMAENGNVRMGALLSQAMPHE